MATIRILCAFAVSTLALAIARVNAARRAPVLPLVLHATEVTRSDVASAAAAPAINFTRQAVDMSGETVLTDVHIRLSDDGNSLRGMVVGERGIVFTSEQPLAAPAPVTWPLVKLWDFPYYAYGVHMFNDSSAMVSGFVDGSGTSYGFIAHSSDAGANWTTPVNISSSWAAGPIRCTGPHCAMLSIDEVEWSSSDGGATWTEQPMPCWLAGSYDFNASTLRQAGCDLCTSTRYGAPGSFSCIPPPDATGIASGYSCAGATCITGGGEIDPIVHGWTYVSTDGGVTWGATRALDVPVPIRTVLALSEDVLIAAGGNIFSGVGGIYTSADGGRTWNQAVSVNEEFKACDAVSTATHAYVYCVSAGMEQGSVYAAQIAL